MPVLHSADARNGVRTTLQNAAVATGAGTAANVAGLRRFSVDLNGITTATVTWQGTLDGTNWRGVSMMNQAGTRAATATADGVYMLPPEYPPMTQFRANITAFTSGTINAILIAAS